jgi:hypothetical protein
MNKCNFKKLPQIRQKIKPSNMLKFSTVVRSPAIAGLTTLSIALTGIAGPYGTIIIWEDMAREPSVTNAPGPNSKTTGYKSLSQSVTRLPRFFSEPGR